MSDPIIVDAHHHVWNLAVRDQEWITGDDLAPLRRSFGLADLRPQAERAAVASTILVQTVPVAEETPELLAQAAAAPLVAGVVGWTDLTAADVADRLARLRELPGGEYLVGVRHQVQGEPDPHWLLRPEVLRGLAAVADAGLVYDLLVLPHQLPAATAAARRLPGLAFVLDHAGKPAVAVAELQPWASHIQNLAGEPNV
ncbi:amidohydrolase family protein, partial [Streptomyces sp. BE20]|uniref:amidohydrolase family protein n=1 Tax=Streptomyces sp. BE20 TaxID=3002525 RepID=UPI002E778903